LQDQLSPPGSERPHRRACFYRRRNCGRRTSASIRSRPKPAAGSKGHKPRHLWMPRSDRACRSGNKLDFGSLGTIFIGPAPPLPRPLRATVELPACAWEPWSAPSEAPPHLCRLRLWAAAPDEFYDARRTAPGTAGNWQNCNGRPRTGTASLPAVARSPSSAAGDSIARSR